MMRTAVLFCCMVAFMSIAVDHLYLICLRSGFGGGMMHVTISLVLSSNLQSIIVYT